MIGLDKLFWCTRPQAKTPTKMHEAKPPVSRNVSVASVYGTQ